MSPVWPGSGCVQSDCWVRYVLSKSGSQTTNDSHSGLFSGKYKVDEIPEEGRFANSAMGDRYRERYFKDATFDALRIIEPVVKENGLTLIETALRWVVHHSELKVKGGTDGIIIGKQSPSKLMLDAADITNRREQHRPIERQLEGS